MAKFLSEEGLRYFYNQIKSKFAAASHNHSAGNITSGTLPIARGGTGATTAANAVKALLGTSALGSSTKPIYYDGAALKACADSIGGGGIVAQLLEENGYVKFANGLILQWGTCQLQAEWQVTTFTYPIAMNNIYAAVICREDSANHKTEYTLTIITKTSNSLTFNGYYGKMNAIIIGK